MKKIFLGFCFLSLLSLYSCSIIIPVAESTNFSGHRTLIKLHQAVLRNQFDWESIQNKEIVSLFHLSDV